MKKSLKLVAVTLTLLMTVALAGPALLAEEANLDSTYRHLSLRIQEKARLTAVQLRDLNSLMQERKEGERRLRRQMLTTFTPEQRGRAVEMWGQRDKSRVMTLEERRELRSKVGISIAQERQFLAYDEKLRAHRTQTAYLVNQILDSQQRQLASDLEFVL